MHWLNNKIILAKYKLVMSPNIYKNNYCIKYTNQNHNYETYLTLAMLETCIFFTWRSKNPP